MECPNQADQAWYRKVVGDLYVIVKFVQASFVDVVVFDSERDTKDEWVKGVDQYCSQLSGTDT